MGGYIVPRNLDWFNQDHHQQHHPHHHQIKVIIFLVVVVFFSSPSILSSVLFSSFSLPFVLLPFSLKLQVMNRKRFYEEFGGEQAAESSREAAPEDFQRMFAGNIDDCFRIGVSLMRKAVKLYSEFYSSDIIIASPLGLRMIIGSEGWVVVVRLFDTFTPKSDQLLTSPAALPAILHHTVWITWLFIAYSGERWL